MTEEEFTNTFSGLLKIMVDNNDVLKLSHKEMIDNVIASIEFLNKVNNDK
jgi:hypothetical protein